MNYVNVYVILRKNIDWQRGKTLDGGTDRIYGIIAQYNSAQVEQMMGDTLCREKGESFRDVGSSPTYPTSLKCLNGFLLTGG